MRLTLDHGCFGDLQKLFGDSGHRRFVGPKKHRVKVKRCVKRDSDTIWHRVQIAFAGPQGNRISKVYQERTQEIVVPSSAFKFDTV
jgi:alkylated DNA nucleotide flippase Atl1